MSPTVTSKRIRLLVVVLALLAVIKGLDYFVLSAHRNSTHSARSQGDEAVLEAIEQRDPEAAIQLIEKKADLSARDKNGYDALLLAVERQYYPVIDKLVDAGVDCDSRDLYGNSALHLAVKAGDIYAIDHLLPCEPDLNARNQRNYTPMHEAAEAGNLPMVKRLVEAGANPHLMMSESANSLPLMVAAKSQRWEVVDFLKQITPGYSLDVAIAYNDLKFVREAIELYSSSLEQGNGIAGKGLTPFMRAVLANHIEMAAMLYKEGKVFDCYSSDGAPLFYPLARNNARDMIKWLKDTGCDINQQPLRWEKKTVLYREALSGHADMVAYLLSIGADANLPDDKGLTPLHVAVVGAFNDVIEVLLAQGANVNAQDDQGRTPLHLAAASGRIDLVVPLIRAGADKTLKDKEDKTALDRAQATGKAPVIAYLSNS